MFRESAHKICFVMPFGPDYAGLTTVGYTLYNGDKSEFQQHTTTGVAETIAGVTGVYVVEVAASLFPDDFDGYIEWDTGETVPAYGYEDIHITSLPGAIKAKTDTLGAGSVRAVSPVAPDGTVLTIVHGDDYSAADGRSLDWSRDSWPDITGASIKLAVKFDYSGTTTQFTGSAVSASQARVQLTAAQTGALDIAQFSYDLQATLASGRVVTLARGRGHVLQDYAT